MPLDMKRPHAIFGAEVGSPTVLQEGSLYTMSGKRLPDGIAPGTLGGYYIPPQYKYLLDAPKAEEVLNPHNGPTIDGFSEAEVRQALLMLKLLKTRNESIDDVAGPVTMGELVADAESEDPDVPDLLEGVGEFIQPAREETHEVVHARGIIEKRPKALKKTVVKIGRDRK